MNYIQKLLPNKEKTRSYVDQEMRTLQSQILQVLYLVTFVIGFGVITFLMSNFNRYNEKNYVLFLGVIFVLFSISAFTKTIPFVPRTLFYLTFIYLLAVGAFIQSGNSSIPFILLMGFSIIAGALLGTKAGIAAGIISLITGIGVSSLILQGVISPSIISINATDRFEWNRSIAVFLLTAAVLIASLIYLINGLQSSLKQTKKLSDEIETEKQKLEKTVIDRTKDLERRAVQIRTVAEISQAISSILNSQILMNRVVNLLQSRFNLYYAGVFLVDDSGQYAVLTAGTGEAGQKMLAEKHRLLIGGVSMIGWTIVNRKAKIALQAEHEEIRFNNPNLPETRSELALPIIGRTKTLGALTIQSKSKYAFDDNDILIFQQIADGIAISLENAQLFEQTQKNLKEITSLNQQYVKRSWEETLLSTGDLSFSYTNPAAVEQPGKPLSLQIPIKLRDQSIGYLEVERNAADFSTDEVSFVEAITLQTALALENARLLQDTQRKAEQDEKVADMTSKFSQAFSIDDILQIAARELGQLPSVSEVSINLSSLEDMNSGTMQLSNGNGKEHSA